MNVSHSPGVSFEGEHTHLYDSVSISTGYFDVCLCLICGNYITVGSSRHRQVSETERILIDTIISLQVQLEGANDD